MRVLLVDDDRELSEYVRRELEEESITVVVAHDAGSGLRQAESQAFDILVLDVMMPFMDGLEVTRTLRGQSILTPILLLTGRDAPEEIVRGLDAGADDYLTKPFPSMYFWRGSALVREDLTRRTGNCALPICCSIQMSTRPGAASRLLR